MISREHKATGQDLAAQIDPGFEHGPAALLDVGATPSAPSAA
ncbi:hypothetical protein [Streptomyces chattanoogensis]|nr:hypothetical protein [Streptomyces chattanoogensis]